MHQDLVGYEINEDYCYPDRQLGDRKRKNG